MKNIHFTAWDPKAKVLPRKGRPIRSTVPVYKASRPRYAKNISKNVTQQLKRSMDASELRIKADRKKFNLRTNYQFQWRPSSSCSSDNPDWFDIYPNRLINNVHLPKTFATLQLGGPRNSQDDYDKFSNIPGKVPTGYREVSQSFESCIVTGTKITVDIEMPNNSSHHDQQYIMGMYYEKDGHFTPNQFVRENPGTPNTKFAYDSDWAQKTSVPKTFSSGLTIDADWIDNNGKYDRNAETFCFQDIDRLPTNFRDMETTKKPATGAPTELMNYSASTNPSSQTRCVKRFEFFWNINSTGQKVNELIADTEPREVWKENADDILAPPASNNQKCAGPYGHMFEKDGERNDYAQLSAHHYHELQMFSNDPSYVNNRSVQNGFLEPSKGGIVRFVLFKKSGPTFNRLTMGKLNIQLDFSVLAFNKIHYDITRVAPNMPIDVTCCATASTIQQSDVLPPIYEDSRGDEEVEMEDAGQIRGEDDIAHHLT